MALHLTQLSRAESETAQQLARVEVLHQQLKSENALAQELLDKLRGEANSYQQTRQKVTENAQEWTRRGKGTGDKGGDHQERGGKLERRSSASHAQGGGEGRKKRDTMAHGPSIGGTSSKPMGKVGMPPSGMGLSELRVEERELRDLERRVRGLEGRVRGFEGLPPDKEMALMEVERMRRELEGLVRKRDGMFEGLRMRERE